MLRIIGTWKPCRQIIKSKFVFTLLRSEKTLHSIGFSIRFEFHAAAISTALPWLISAPLIFQQRPLRGDIHSIKHGFQKCSQGRFAPAIFSVNHIETFRKIHLHLMQLSKI